MVSLGGGAAPPLASALPEFTNVNTFHEISNTCKNYMVIGVLAKKIFEVRPYNTLVYATKRKRSTLLGHQLYMEHNVVTYHIRTEN